MIYIEGYALSCALGNTVSTSVQKLHEKISEPTLLNDGNRYYYINAHQEQNYYESIINIAQEALLNANLTDEEIENIGLFIGTSSAKVPLNEKALQKEGEMLGRPNLSELSSVVMQQLEMKGFNTIISTACTSSANAMVQAKEMIEVGLIEKALVIGVELYNELSIKGFNSFQLLSQDKIRPFDQQRDGVILGEGISALILGKKKSPFEFSSGSSMMDTISITSSSSQSLVRVMQSSLKKAKLVPKDIAVIKAHATGTIQNDLAEAQALNELFPNHPCIIALKPYIGHTMGACGTNEFILLIEALKENFLPKALNFSTEISEYPLTPLREECIPLKGYYLFNYVGFGGNNCSLIIKYHGA